MADMIDNRIEVSGDEEEIKKFIKLMGDDFDFNRIIPMPEVFSNCSSYPIPKEESERLIKEYGFDKGREWADANWGTKWLPSDVVMEKGDDWVSYEFQTPWVPPEPVYDKLMEMFPSLSFEFYYHLFEWWSV